MIRDIDKDHQRFKRVVVITINLFLALIMFATMNISSYFGKLMAQHNIAVMLIVLAVVSIFQIALNIGSTLHRVPNANPNPNLDNNTMIIFYILLLSSVISSIEVRLVSNTAAAIITFILYHITLTSHIQQARDTTFNLGINSMDLVRLPISHCRILSISFILSRDENIPMVLMLV